MPACSSLVPAFQTGFPCLQRTPDPGLRTSYKLPTNNHTLHAEAGEEQPHVNTLHVQSMEISWPCSRRGETDLGVLALETALQSPTQEAHVHTFRSGTEPCLRRSQHNTRQCQQTQLRAARSGRASSSAELRQHMLCLLRDSRVQGTSVGIQRS